MHPTGEHPDLPGHAGPVHDPPLTWLAICTGSDGLPGHRPISIR